MDIWHNLYVWNEHYMKNCPGTCKKRKQIILGPADSNVWLI